jgi:putative endonuclease
MANRGDWWLYLLRCHNDLLYAGTSNDVARRFAAHQAGKGARFTRINPPIAILAAQPFANRSLACRAESALRRRSRQQKLAWAATWRWHERQPEE